MNSNYTLGGKGGQNHNDTKTIRSSSIQAGNYTIDIIRKSNTNQSN
jgi:hypothetical protein